ncbi:hypothetical protein [Luteolibacter marinus]|uniref:hypothetical protein n=1 Tax=Luteolibacter marinus TaxID=2776705 RepID=UPI001866FFBD|nr:hypothetical protein [Luteolibacter marinus]
MKSPRESDRGFALVVCMLMLSFLMILAVGLMSLASIELRRSGREDQLTVARSNARMALMLAIGQLQENLGPDRRVSATAELLGDHVAQPQWTGVWRTHPEGMDSWFERDDLDGGLKDLRWGTGRTPGEDVMSWLVSGDGEPTLGAKGETVEMVGAGTTGDASSGAVEVPLVEVADEGGKKTGHYGWWTGDLGVRANLATTDPRSGTPADRGAPGNGGMFRVMASQSADSSFMGGSVEITAEESRRLATAGTAALTDAGSDWRQEHAFDFTAESSGVLVDVMRGGLKKDLTAYLASGGSIDAEEGLPGLSDDEVMIGEPGDTGISRYRQAGPRFGVLRDWAKNATTFSNAILPSKLTDLGSGAAATSRNLALANEQPVKLAGNQRSGLKPILVEATNYTHLSTFLLDSSEGSTPEYQLRHLHYPRVVLWNPYNCELQSDRMMVMIQGNGRQELWTENVYFIGGIERRFNGQWLSFEGGRSTQFNAQGKAIMSTEGYLDPYIGSYYFTIPLTKFGPGECLVFSPARAAEYDSLSPYRQGPYNLNANELSCTVAPDPSRCYYISGTDIGGGIPYRPTSFWYAPTPYWSGVGRYGVENQGDDTRAILKNVGFASTITFEDFDALPQVSVLSASLQFGAGREPRVSWNQYERMPMQLLDRADPHPTVVPNVRTREGIRLRWFNEHPSNLSASGALAGTPHFEDALLANWNPRASFILRSPWDNVAGNLAVSGKGGGPWFFGAYTRDLYDQAVSWDEQAPVPRGGRYHGNPFGPPQEGAERYVLFDVPRHETGVISLAQFQHVKLSELVWQPSYAIGNSLADPRLGGGGTLGLEHTSPRTGSLSTASMGGFHHNELGWSNDKERSTTRAEWAMTARAILGEVPETDNLVYDLSFEVNQALWDRFFLSSGSELEKDDFLADPQADPLPNGRMHLATTTLGTATSETLNDYHRAAYQLMVDGAFNVNSTRVEAWKALLGSTRRSHYGTTDSVPFPRVLDAPGGAWRAGDDTDGDSAWAGYRELTQDEIERLAEEIVEQVKLRGPFISLADFVNRRLADDETGRMGALQAAIERAGLNEAQEADFPLDNEASLPDYNHPDNLRDATRMEQTLKPSSKVWGAPSYLTQADVLQVIGPALTARSDTFVIRAYGDAVDAEGKLQARAWCEAVVQRTPEPIRPDASGLNSELEGEAGDFGRRFVVTSFRWLQPGEV